MSLDKEGKFNPVAVAVKWAMVVSILILSFPVTFYFLYEVDDIDKEIRSNSIESSTVVESKIDPESGLIINKGFEIVRGTCGACHALNLVTQNTATREGWKDIIVWMQQTQKLWELGENEVIILDYLEKNYAPKEQGRRAPLKDIEWYEL